MFIEHHWKKLIKTCEQDIQTKTSTINIMPLAFKPIELKTTEKEQVTLKNLLSKNMNQMK